MRCYQSVFIIIITVMWDQSVKWHQSVSTLIIAVRWGQSVSTPS